jgi:hypothetical protein
MSLQLSGIIREATGSRRLRRATFSTSIRDAPDHGAPLVGEGTMLSGFIACRTTFPPGTRNGIDIRSPPEINFNCAPENRTFSCSNPATSFPLFPSSRTRQLNRSLLDFRSSIRLLLPQGFHSQQASPRSFFCFFSVFFPSPRRIYFVL